MSPLSFVSLTLTVFSMFFLLSFKRAHSQDERVEQIEQEERIETVKVTGQRLRQIDLESDKPISIIDRQQIEASGETSLGGLLREAIEIDGVAAENVLEPNSGRSVLMGLHSAPVLVLLNGRRFITGPGSLLSPPGADISTIPVSSIERIEILKDSMAAIYGAGAIGGVVNIITRNESERGEVLLQYSQPRGKGGVESQLSAAKSFSGSKYNLNTAFGYNYTQPLIEGDRDYMSPNISIFSDYPTRFIYDARVPPAPSTHEDCGKEGLSKVNKNTGHCEMDISPLRNIIPKIHQYSGLIDFNYHLTKNWILFSTTLLSRKQINSVLESSPGIIYASDMYDNDVPDFVFRYFEAGPRSSVQYTTFYDINLGLKNRLSSNWNWSHHIGISSFKHELDGKNFLQDREASNLYDCKDGPEFALEEGDCDSGNYFDPFAPKGDRGDLSSALRNPSYWEASALMSFQSHVEGDLGTFPLEVMGGLQFWRDLYTLDAPEESYLLTPKIEDANKHREVASALLGLGIPFFNSKLKMDFNLRWDWYSDFGSGFTPRIAVVTHLFPNLLLRSSVGRSFQAPSLLYRYGPDSNLFANIIDKVACEEAQQQERDGDTRAPQNIAKYCSSQRIPTNIVSNKNLGVESADTANIGLLFNANSNFHVGVDWWYLARHNYIGPVLSDGTKLEYEGKWPKDQEDIVFHRLSNGISGVTDIISLDTTIVNLTKNEISGLDFSSSYSFPLFTGQFTLSDKVTYTIFNKMRPFTQLKAENKVGLYNYPQWKNNLRLSWATNEYRVSLLLRSYAGQKQENETAPSLPSYSELDLTLDMTIFKNSIVNFGGKNILSAVPPTQDSQVNRFNNRLYSQRGPRFFASYKYMF